MHNILNIIYWSTHSTEDLKGICCIYFNFVGRSSVHLWVEPSAVARFQSTPTTHPGAVQQGTATSTLADSQRHRWQGHHPQRRHQVHFPLTFHHPQRRHRCALLLLYITPNAGTRCTLILPYNTPNAGTRCTLPLLYFIKVYGCELTPTRPSENPLS